MLTFILFHTFLLYTLVELVAKRPNYRLDYQYEKSFDNFYKLHKAATTWAEARIRCQAEGSELLVPESLDEADAMPLLITSILNKFEGIFVGIHDLYSERTFVSIRGALIKDSIINLLWEYKQPEYKAGRCVAMRRTGRIFVFPCDKSLPFICKTKGSQIVFYKECNTFDNRWTLGPNGTCYFMQTEPRTWFEAHATCLGAGGSLAILHSQSEADYVRVLFKQHRPKRIPLDDFAFLGFNDLFQRHHYRTVHGERVPDLGYKEWEISCPEGYTTSSASSLGERCGGMRRSGLLAVSACDLPAMFFCEKPTNSSPVHNILRTGLLPETGHIKEREKRKLARF